MERTNDELKQLLNSCSLLMVRSRYRLWSFNLVIITLAVLILSFYFEYVRGLNPCPLCWMQRSCVVLLLVLVCANFYLHRSAAARSVLLGQMLVASAGIFLAARQLWLQSLPTEQIPVCLPGIGAMIHYLPWSDVAHALLLGGGDCAEVSWTWLGLSMPGWTMLYFLGMLLASLLSYLHLRNFRVLFKKKSHL